MAIFEKNAGSTTIKEKKKKKRDCSLINDLKHLSPRLNILGGSYSSLERETKVLTCLATHARTTKHFEVGLEEPSWIHNIIK